MKTYCALPVVDSFPYGHIQTMVGASCRDRMVVGFTTTCTISVYHHSWRGVLDTTLCEKVCQRLATDRWFSPGTPVSSPNKTDRHDITEILLKVALNTINQTIKLWSNDAPLPGIGDTDHGL